MRRKDKEICNYEDIEKILTDAKIGILGLCIDGSAYTVPVNFAYYGGAIFFHSSEKGKKIKALKNNNAVSFLTFIEGDIIAAKPPCRLTQAYKSVMINGKASFIKSISEKREALLALNKKYYPYEEYLSLDEETVRNFKSKAGINVEVIKITIDSITGKSNAWKQDGV
ncbi:MAG: pyridoxamine 5'-phosphate oxidase family protein [bacterium]